MEKQMEKLTTKKKVKTDYDEAKKKKNQAFFTFFPSGNSQG